MSRDRFVDETVLITGAGSSVGRVMAERFAAEGAQVHICDVQEELLVKTLDVNPDIRGTLGSVARPEDVRRIFYDARAWLGEITILINTVGIGGPRAPIEDVSTEEWLEAISVNVNGMFYCIREAVPAMKRAKHGAIINFSSGSTRTGLPYRTPYVVSKFAVEGMSRNLARELGPHNIRVNAILPGMIDNDRMRGIVRRSAESQRKSVAEVEAAYLSYISMRTKISPDEIADMVLFLTSTAGRHVSGQLIGVDGNIEWEV